MKAELMEAKKSRGTNAISFLNYWEIFCISMYTLLIKAIPLPPAMLLKRASEKYPSILAYSGDAGYRGTSVKFTYEKLDLTLHYFSEKIKDIWAVLPKRWVVERTFSWLN
jgi:hypothetical protein